MSELVASKCNVALELYHIQWNLCIMDTLGPTKGVLIFQVSLYDKAPFGTTARCPDYAGVHIFKCPVKQVPLYSYVTILEAN